MRVAVMGTGGVGGFFGGLLARNGIDVTFIARGAHLDAIRRDGLAVVSDLYGEFNAGTAASDSTEEVGPVDVVLYSVKMYHNAEAIPQMRPLVGPDTVVLTLQNGVDNGEQIAAQLGRQHVMEGMAVVQAGIQEPGRIFQRGQLGSVTFGEIDGGTTDRGRRMLELFQRGDWNVELSDYIMRALWRKFIFLTATAQVNAVTQIDYHHMRTIPETRQLIKDGYDEIISVGEAAGIDLGDDVRGWCENSLDAFPGEGMSSLANDLKAGNRIELEGLTGAAARLGRAHGVPTPICDTIYALMKPAALRAEASS